MWKFVLEQLLIVLATNAEDTFQKWHVHCKYQQWAMHIGWLNRGGQTQTDLSGMVAQCTDVLIVSEKYHPNGMSLCRMTNAYPFDFD